MWPTTRESNYKFGSNLGGGRRGWLPSPPAPPAFRGALPHGPPKRRSTPLAAVVVRFLATETPVRGRTVSQKILFLNKPLVRGNCAAWGRTISQKSEFFDTPLVRAAALPGAELDWKHQTFFEETTCPGQLRCLGQNFLSESVFLKNPLVQGSCAA